MCWVNNIKIIGQERGLWSGEGRSQVEGVEVSGEAEEPGGVRMGARAGLSQEGKEGRDGKHGGLAEGPRVAGCQCQQGGRNGPFSWASRAPL